MQSRTPLRKARFGRLTKFGLLCAALMIGLFAVGSALLVSPPFDGLRRNLAQWALRNLVDARIEVRGGVEFSVLDAGRVRIGEVSIANPSWAGQRHLLRLQSLDVGFRLSRLLMGEIGLRHLRMQSAELNVETRDDGTSNWPATTPAQQPARAAKSFALSALADLTDIAITNAWFRRIDKAHGFNASLRLDSLKSRPDPDRHGLLVSGSGALNDEPLEVDGRLPLMASSAARQTGDASLQLSASSRHFRLTMQTINAGAAPPAGGNNKYALDLRVSSLGRFLEVLGAQRSFDGQGRASGTLVVGSDKLALDDFTSELTTTDQDYVVVSGAAGDLATGSELAFEFGVRLATGATDFSSSAAQHNDDFRFNFTGPRQQDAAQDMVGAFEGLKLRELSGRVSGSFDDLRVSALKIATTALEPEIKSIGPISVGAFRLDDSGRLQLLDINAIAGPEHNPTIRARGDIKDLLRLADARLEGVLAVPVARMFAAAPASSAAQLGVLRGRFRLADANGRLFLDYLDAETKQTDLVRVKLRTHASLEERRQGTALEVAIEVPKYRDLARAIGAPSHQLGRLKLEGQWRASPQTASVTARIHVGQSAVAVDLSAAPGRLRPITKGEIAVSRLRLSDLRAVHLIFAGGDTPPTQVRGTTGNRGRSANTATSRDWWRAVLNATDLDLKARIGEISDGRTRISELNGRLTVVDRKLTLDPFKLTYLGARIGLRGSVDGRQQPARAQLKTRLIGWQLDRVLRELAGTNPAPISGRLNADIALQGQGDTTAALLKSMHGRAALVLSGGRINSSLVALTGLDLSGYLFSDAAAKGYTAVHCLIARFGIKNGIATTSNVLLDTPDIRMTGRGTINLKSASIKMRFEPYPKRRKIVELTTPFSIVGPLSAPKLLTHGTAERAIGEIIFSDVNLLGSLVGLIADDGKTAANPCLGRRPPRRQRQRQR